MFYSFQPSRLLNFDLSPNPFGALARRQFRFVAWCGALAVTLWVSWNPAAAQTTAATTITLATTAAGKTVTTVASGTVVTLTATVRSGTTTVATGQVSFCDASAKYCTDINMLGSAQLTSAGTAVMKFRPGIGSRTYKAVFLGTNTYSGSSSSGSALTVTGSIPTLPTAATINQTGSWGAYALSATVTENGNTAGPSGSISFLDTNHGNAVLGTGTLGTAIRGINWTTVNTSAPNLAGVYYSVADLNGDGFPDLFIKDYFGTYDALLGNGDGTFTMKGAAFGPSSQTGAFILGDFNNDGISDIAAINAAYYAPNNTITIFLGNGDGTFTVAGSSPAIAMSPSGIATADVNGDGNADLVVSQTDSSGNGETVVLLGNGNGTFTQSSSPVSVGSTAVSIVPVDLNRDGKVDLVLSGSGITILLGKGDGTFSVMPGPAGAGQTAAAVADLNNDGFPDLVFAAAGTSYLTVFLGDGNGTFIEAPPSQNIVVGNSLAIADLNQDGIPDVVYANGTTGVLFGNGDGTFVPFSATLSFSTYGFGTAFVLADFNGDGWPDVLAVDGNGRTIADALTQPTETVTASAAMSITAAGAHLVAARYPGDSNYNASTSGTISLWGTPPATTTSLTLTSGGIPVTSVRPGTAVVLTATVNVATNPVTAGEVNFCDASVAGCSDIHLLGTAVVGSGGKATYKFVPGPGVHRYRAVFVQDGYGLTSSSTAVTLTVGPAPSPVYSETTAISLDGFPGDYSLTATVVGFGGPASPTGAVSFVDTSFGNNVLATASLGTGVPGVGFLQSLSPSFGSYPAIEVTADFNGDGIPDLAILSTNTYGGGAYTVAVFLGNGDGKFRAGPTIAPSDLQSYPSMISGDFNGDGKPDLAILSWNGYSTNYITILLNNGDGSFSAKPTVVAFNQGSVGGDGLPGAMAVADFNGDGKLDLAVVGDYISVGGVTILLGNGDGTFNAGSILLPNQDFGQVAIGDFNGDDVPDLVVTHYFEFGTPPTILLGKGDGTFSTKLASFSLDYFPTSIVVGDFNGDGILDLAFSDLNGIEIALGNGDGTFNETSASPIQVPDELYSLQAGDFNHDGKLDLAGWDTYFGQIVLLLGAGDGMFAVTKTTPGVSPSTFGVHQIAAADFNEDGVPDLAMLTYSVNTVSILLTEPTETATTTTVNGIAPLGAGTHNVEASYSGDSTYQSGVSDTVPLTAALAPIVFTPAAGTYTTPVTITLSESIPGSTIYYSASGTVSTNGFVPYTSPIPITESGVATILAYATETGYLQSYYAPETFTINLPMVLISNLSPPIKAAGSSAFALTVNGLGFTSSSTVNWGSTALSTKYVSGTELTAQVPGSAIANAGTATLIVQTPGIGSSNALMFEIDSAGSNMPPNFTTSSATVNRASSANYTVTLPSSASNVSATCLNLPSGATCSYSVTTGAVTINTSSSTPTGTYQIIVVFTETLPGLASASLFLPILLLPRLFLTRKWAAKRFWLTAGLALLVSAMAIGSGCGGGGNAPAPQTHQVTTSGVVTLTVQ